MLCTLMLLLPVFSRGDTNVNNNVDADERIVQTITGTNTDADSGELTKEDWN